MIKSGKIDKQYYECINNFLKTGTGKCEDVVLTDLREHSFFIEIVSFIVMTNKKNKYIITVGRDHVPFLKNKLLAIDKNVQTLHI